MSIKKLPKNYESFERLERTDIVKSLRETQKKDNGMQCLQCRHYDTNKGKCQKWNIRVKYNELCDSYLNTITTGPLNEYTREQFNDLKTYQKIPSTIPTKGIMVEESYVPRPSPAEYKPAAPIKDKRISKKMSK